MQNYECRIIRGREIEFRLLSEADFRRGNVTCQVWAILPDKKEVLIGETRNRKWALAFVRMIPTANEGGQIKVVIVESNGLKQKKSSRATDTPSDSIRRQIQGIRLRRLQNGRIDWASFGREE